MFGWSLTFTCCLYLLKEGKLNLSEMFEPSPEQVWCVLGFFNAAGCHGCGL